MSGVSSAPKWNILPPVTIAEADRLEHVRACSDFAAALLERQPDWQEGLDEANAPDPGRLRDAVREHGLDHGLRLFRNREMLRIIWRDLCGLAPLGETFANLTLLAELCLEAAIDEHQRRLQEQHGTPRGEDGSPQRLFVIGLGKFGGVELNLSSDIDLLFCFPSPGSCDGRRGLANDQFFTRLARAVIASLAEITEAGFCFRVDTRLRPFGHAGPLACSLASMEQYYQREGRDWERYALIKARPVAGDSKAGERFIERIRPFVYRRYIDYSSVESLQEMHASVQEDARRKDRLDDIKRGPGGIREVEFLAQCFQILRGGREPGLQTPSLECALQQIEKLGLLSGDVVNEVRNDYAFLRFLENRIQALRDQQTHRLPQGADRERIARAMYEPDVASLDSTLQRTRKRVSERFRDIFPERPQESGKRKWIDQWQRLRREQQPIEAGAVETDSSPLEIFTRRLDRVALSQRASQRLDRFMPELLERVDRLRPNSEALNRIFDLVLAVSRRSAYLVLLVQNPQALDRMLDLFQRSERIAAKVIRFPALLDELIDPSLGRQIPGRRDLLDSVGRILQTRQDTEAVLEGLNYLKLATELRIAVGQLEAHLEVERAQQGLSDLACALLGGVLDIASREIAARHGRFAGPAPDHTSTDDGLAIIGYGTLGAGELGFGSDLDIVFLFASREGVSDGARPLPAERYYARMAQRVLSFLTVMTPSGRLYEVDTRLRPNGRAGSLVSSISAFHDYQLNEAWTWELQALTRARFVAGSHAVAVQFNRIRQEVLCRDREAAGLAAELLEMRRKMAQEHDGQARIDSDRSPKYRPGGLIDIEFVTQLGVLTAARLYPRVIQATGTLPQLEELKSIGWLTAEQHSTLRQTLLQLRTKRMLAALVPGEDEPTADTSEAAAVFAEKMGGSAR